MDRMCYVDMDGLNMDMDMDMDVDILDMDRMELCVVYVIDMIEL